MSRVKNSYQKGDKEIIHISSLDSPEEGGAIIIELLTQVFKGNEILQELLRNTKNSCEGNMLEKMHGENVDLAIELFEAIQECKSKNLLIIELPNGEKRSLDLSVDSEKKDSDFEQTIREFVAIIENRIMKAVIIGKYDIATSSKKGCAESISKLTGTDAGVDFHTDLLFQVSRQDPKAMSRGKTLWNQLAHEFKDCGGMPKNLGYLRRIMCEKKKASTATVLRRIDAYLRILEIEIVATGDNF